MATNDTKELAGELNRISESLSAGPVHFDAAARRKAVELASSAMNVKSLQANAGVTALEPHQMEAMGLARAIARHDGPDVANPFTDKQLSKAYAGEQNHVAFLTRPAGRWLVQQYDEGKGVYADQMQTNSAATAVDLFRSSNSHRVIDTKLKDIAADYPRNSYADPPGPEKFSMRSQLELAAITERQAREARFDPARGNAQMATEFLAANSREERKAATGKYPALANAFALEEAFSRIGHRIKGAEAADAFMGTVRRNIVQDIASGRELKTVQIREASSKQAIQVHDRDVDRGR